MLWVKNYKLNQKESRVKKSLKKPKGQTECVNQRRTMDKRKSTKEQTTIYKTYT